MATDRWTTIKEISHDLRISEVTAWRAVSEGSIPGGKQVRDLKGSTWRVDTRAYKDYLSKSRSAEQNGDAAENAVAEDTITKQA